MLLRIAPHLVKPLPIALPTYEHGLTGKEFLGAGFLAYDALTVGKNRAIVDRSRHIPSASFMSRTEVLNRIDGVKSDKLTGAAVFHDAQMYHPPRLVLAFVLSAIREGAVALNYVEALSFLRKSDRIAGVVARDRLTGEQFDIRSKVVLNAAGPWSETLLQDSERLKIPDAGVYSRDTCFVINGAPEPECGLAVQGASVDTGSLIGRGERHLFVVPWRGRRLIGVWHIVYRKSPNAIEVAEEELERFLKELNGSLKSHQIERQDIRMVNAGLVPFGESDETGEKLDFGKQSHLVDSAPVHGLEGLISLIGVRHTMARGDAVKAIDIVDRKLRRSGNTPDSSVRNLLGGDVEDFDSLAERVQNALTDSDSQDLCTELTALYGSCVFDLLEIGRSSGSLDRIRKSEVIGAQIDVAVRDEMAVTLGDLVFRRTPLAAAGDPGADVLADCARIMGEKQGWTKERLDREIKAVTDRFPTATRSGRISEPQIESIVGIDLTN